MAKRIDGDPKIDEEYKKQLREAEEAVELARKKVSKLRNNWKSPKTRKNISGDIIEENIEKVKELSRLTEDMATGMRGMLKSLTEWLGIRESQRESGRKYGRKSST